MTSIDDLKSKEELADDIKIEIQALGINLNSDLGSIKFLLILIFILGVISLVHFW